MHHLRADAKRLFFVEDSNAKRGSWVPSYDATYRTRRQIASHAERDGAAFASVALPAQYSAIYAVLAQAKWRLGPLWNVTNVIDFGSGAGSGIWYEFQPSCYFNAAYTRIRAAMHSFQVPDSKILEPRVSQSTIESYISIDKRNTLITLAKKLAKST